jgi:hypothetical protein
MAASRAHDRFTTSLSLPSDSRSPPHAGLTAVRHHFGQNGIATAPAEQPITASENKRISGL